jgi:hypothetical protein
MSAADARFLPSVTAVIVVLPMTVLGLGTVWAGFGAAAIPAAIIASEIVPDPRLQPTTRHELLRLGMVWGFMAALSTVLIVVLATFIGSVAGLVPAPETLIGYAVFAVITVASIAPLLAVPMCALGIVWALMSDRAAHGFVRWRG